MKKSLLVAALVAGFAGVASAETSVTLYGIVDASVGYEQVRGTVIDPRTGVQLDVNGKRSGYLNGMSAPSRWGLKGSEDLGEGLKAVFVLENGFDSGTGQAAQGGRLFGRQATVGLASDAWGKLEFGRQTNIASKYLAGVVSPFGTTYGQAQAGTTFGATASVRYDNMIMYQTPNYAGFQIGVGYSFNTSGNQRFNSVEEPNDRAWTAGARYTNGPLAAALTYDQLRVRDARFAPGSLFVGQEGTRISSWNMGASYDFSVVKVFAGFGQARNGWLAPIRSTDSSVNYNAGGFVPLDGLKVNSYTLGLSAPLGGGQVLASWGMADPRNLNGAHAQQVYSLGYDYALSKRTGVYAIGSYARHFAFQDDLKSTLLAVGLRHRF